MQLPRCPTFLRFAARRGLLGLAAAIGLFMPGCGGSSADLDEVYGLDANAARRGPAADVGQIAEQLDVQFRSREGDMKLAVAEAQETLAGYSPEQFGDKAILFGQLTAGLEELKEMVDGKAPRGQVQEKVGALKDLGDQIAGGRGEAPG